MKIQGKNGGTIRYIRSDRRKPTNSEMNIACTREQISIERSAIQVLDNTLWNTLGAGNDP